MALIDADGLAAWRGLLKAHGAAVRRIEADLLERQQVPLEWYDVLVAIRFSPGGRLRMSDLADELVLTRSNATRLVDRLEARGLVAREQSPHDGRGQLAALTVEGSRALRRAWPTYARGIQSHFLDFLSAREQRVLAVALGRVEVGARTRRPGRPL